MGEEIKGSSCWARHGLISHVGAFGVIRATGETFAELEVRVATGATVGRERTLGEADGLLEVHDGTSVVAGCFRVFPAYKIF